MRTILTLDDDVAPPTNFQEESYSETVYHAVLAPDLNLTGFNGLANELEDEAIGGLARP